MTFRISVTSEGIVEVEFFGATTFSDRAAALDALGEAGELPKPLRLLVNFLGAELRSQDDAGRLDFIAKAITHPILENSRAALVGVSHADAHPSETAGVIRLIKVRSFEARDQAMRWLLGEV